MDPNNPRNSIWSQFDTKYSTWWGLMQDSREYTKKPPRLHWDYSFYHSTDDGLLRIVREGFGFDFCPRNWMLI